MQVHFYFLGNFYVKDDKYNTNVFLVWPDDQYIVEYSLEYGMNYYLIYLALKLC